MPFRGEEERSGGRVLLFRVEIGKLELVSILLLPDPVTGISHLLLPKREIQRCRETRYGGKRGVAIIKNAATYDVGGFLLVARGRTLETFKFRRAPGGNGRLVGWSETTKTPLVLPTDGKTGNRDKAAILAAAQDTNDPMALERALKTEVPFDSAQLRKHGSFFNTQLFVHSLSVLSNQYVLVADIYRSVQFVRWKPEQNELSFLGQDLDGPLECYAANYVSVVFQK